MVELVLSKLTEVLLALNSLGHWGHLVVQFQNVIMHSFDPMTASLTCSQHAMEGAINKEQGECQTS